MRAQSPKIQTHHAYAREASQDETATTDNSPRHRWPPTPRSYKLGGRGRPPAACGFCYFIFVVFLLYVILLGVYRYLGGTT